MVNRRQTIGGTAGGRLRLFFDIVLAAAVMGLLGLAALRLDEMASQDVSGTPRVADGDSLVMDGRRLRLRGIDAPELGQTCSRNGTEYACGREARDALAALIDGRVVTCRGWEQDRYGRLLVHCQAGEFDLNAEMVRAGWAIAYGDYLAQEADARQAARGLWAGSFDRPSDWRVMRGDAAEADHAAGRLLFNWLAQLFGGAGDPGSE